MFFSDLEVFWEKKKTVSSLKVNDGLGKKYSHVVVEKKLLLYEEFANIKETIAQIEKWTKYIDR